MKYRGIILLLVVFLTTGCGITAFRYKKYINPESNVFKNPDITPKTDYDLYIKDLYFQDNGFEFDISLFLDREYDGLFNKEGFEDDNYFITSIWYRNTNNDINFNEYQLVFIESLTVISVKGVTIYKNKYPLQLDKTDVKIRDLNSGGFTSDVIEIPISEEEIFLSFNLVFKSLNTNKIYEIPIKVKLKKWQKTIYLPFCILFESFTGE